MVQMSEEEREESGAWARDPESTVREGDSQKKVRRTFKILKEV